MLRVLHKNAIALLLTLLFIMLITISITVGLKQVNKASSALENENFLFQSSIIVDDLLNLLKISPELDAIESADAFRILLTNLTILPLEVPSAEVSIEVASARSKLNINHFTNEERLEVLRNYLSRNLVDVSFTDILQDSMSGIKSDLSYKSTLFDQRPDLYRDYITSPEHLNELVDFYSNYYNDDSLEKIDMSGLFYFSDNKEYKLDLNYLTPEVWDMLLACGEDKATQLSLGIYNSIEDIDLSTNEKSIVEVFDTSFFEPYVDIVINIKKNDKTAKIRFEYDIKNKKGSNFVYDI